MKSEDDLWDTGKEDKNSSSDNEEDNSTLDLSEISPEKNEEEINLELPDKTKDDSHGKWEQGTGKKDYMGSGNRAVGRMIASEVGPAQWEEGLQGKMGGYIAASSEIIDYIRSFAPGFIFTTSICPSIAAGAAKAIDIVSLAEQLRIRIKKNAALIRENLDSLAIPYLDTNSHIVAVLINDPFLCKKVSKDLIDDHGIYAQPIFYPTVPVDLHDPSTKKRSHLTSREHHFIQA